MQGSKAGSYLEGNCARANEALAVYAAAFAAAHCALVWMTSARPLRHVLAKGRRCKFACLLISVTMLEGCQTASTRAVTLLLPLPALLGKMCLGA